MSQPLTYIDGTCQIGQQEACGKPATNVIAVRSVKDVAWGHDAREGGVVLMCDDHAGTPANQWHAVNDTPRTCPECGSSWTAPVDGCPECPAAHRGTTEQETL